MPTAGQDYTELGRDNYSLLRIRRLSLLILNLITSILGHWKVVIILQLVISAHLQDNSTPEEKDGSRMEMAIVVVEDVDRSVDQMQKLEIRVVTVEEAVYTLLARRELTLAVAKVVSSQIR